MTPAQLKDKHDTMDQSRLHYLVREPKATAPKKKAIILLHGVGSNEQDLFGLADYLPAEFYIISARGQFTVGPGRFAWYNVDFSTGKPVINSEQEHSSRKVIRQFVSEIRNKYKLDEVYLGGFSQGAIMSYSVGLDNPAEVDGILAFSGRILQEIQTSLTVKDELKNLKVFLAHGVQDGTLPIHYAREGRSFLEQLGVKLSYHEYPIGHQINEAVLNDVNVWLSERSIDTGDR